MLKSNSMKTPRLNSTALAHLATRIFNVPLLIHPQKGDMIINVLGRRLGLSAESIPVVAFDDDLLDSDPPPPYTVADNGVATIPINGTLVKKGAGMNALSGLTSYEALTSAIEDALTDPAVKAVLFDIASPGGEAAGMADLSDMIFSARGSKPMFAISNDDCYSAAYGIGSAADKMFTTRDGGVGSVGCYMMHCDRSQYNQNAGLKYTYIFNGAKKVDGNPMQPLSDSALADLQAEVDRIAASFISMVARNRNVTPQQIADTQAGCLYANAAAPLLADFVGTKGQCMSALCGAAGVAEVPQTGDEDIEDPDDPMGPIPGTKGKKSRRLMIPGASLLDLSALAAAIPYQKTATSTDSWDGAANESRLPSPMSVETAKAAYAWMDNGQIES